MSDDVVPRPMQVRATALRLQALGFEADDVGPGPPEPMPPQIIDSPAVTVNGSVVATCVVGDTLTCTNGNWSHEPTDYWHSWLAGSVLVGNGTTYTAKAADEGQSMSCSVTATNAQGSTNAMSNSVMVEPQEATSP